MALREKGQAMRSTTPAGVRMRGSARREQIRAVALELFSEHGYQQTSLRQIADRLGFTRAALYYHYEAKEDLLREVITPLLDRLEDLLGASPERVTGSAQRRAILASFMHILLEHRGIVELMGNDRAVLAHPELGGRWTELRERLHSRLAGPDGGIERQIKAAAAIGALTTVVVRYAEASEAMVEEVGLRIARAILSAR